MPPTRLHTVADSEAGKTLLEWLQSRLRLPNRLARQHLSSGQIRINGTPCQDPRRRLIKGQRIEAPLTISSADVPTEPPQHRILLRHVDDHLVIVEKPAGLTTMRHPDEAAEFGTRARRFLPSTLADLLPNLLASHLRGRPLPVRAVHRLDRDTTGLVVFARTPEAERHLGAQFRSHSVERLYQAIVRGQAVSGRIESWLIADRGDGRRGSSNTPGQGQRAVTHVRVLESFDAFTFVECRLETGRTHQVRIHLGEAGTPLCGERVYDRPLHGKPIADSSGIRRVALHAATLGVKHPASGEMLRWSAPLPADMAELLTRLRRG